MNSFLNGRIAFLSLGLLGMAALAVAQDQPHPWRSVNEPPPPVQVQAAPATPDQPAAADQAAPVPADNGAVPEPYPPPPPPAQNGPDSYQAPPPPPQGAANPSQSGAVPGPQGNYSNVPAHLTIKPGTYVAVRVNQWLSSDKNQAGDAFAATLAEPVIVDGVVVAQRGQTVGGRVSEAQKAGRVEGTSRLGVQLTDLTLVDGQTVPIRSQMINRNGPTSEGRDAAAIGGTTALGATVGAAADWGRGAAIGAGAGAAAGILGVLLTRGRPTVIYPESVLTFRVEAPIEISTEHAPQAFHYADQQDYGQRYSGQGPPPRPLGPPAYGYAAPAPPPYYYGPGYYPYWGPGVSLFIGPRFGYVYGPRFYGYYRGFRR